MTKLPPKDYFTKEASLVYDERNSRLAPMDMYFLIRLILKNLPAKARILCVGVGTGAEILNLSKTFSEWQFVGVDPSGAMLEVCTERLKSAGVSERCQLVHGYVQDLPNGEAFDAALSMLVTHFVKPDERLDFFQNITSRLKEAGVLINTEISFDLNSAEFPSMVEQWGKIQALMGATPESLANLPQQLREMLSVLPPSETEDLLRKSGILMPVRFFQAFMIVGWYGRKTTNTSA